MVVSGVVSSFVLSHSSMSPLECPLLLHALRIPVIRNPPMPLDFQCKEPLTLGIPNSHHGIGMDILYWPGLTLSFSIFGGFETSILPSAYQYFLELQL